MALALLTSTPLATAVRAKRGDRAGAAAAQHHKAFVVAKRRDGAVRLPTTVTVPSQGRRACAGAVRLPAARAFSSSRSSVAAAADVRDDDAVTPPVVALDGVAEVEGGASMMTKVEDEWKKMRNVDNGFGSVGVGSLAAAAGVLALGGLLAMPPSALAAAAEALTPVADAAAGEGSLTDGFFSAFLLIFFSEIGDKTFFIAVLLALQQVGRLRVYRFLLSFFRGGAWG